MSRSLRSFNLNPNMSILTADESDYMLSPNIMSMTYGDNGGILSPSARLGPNNRDALIPTVIPETSNSQVANVLSPSARLNLDIQSQVEEFKIFGIKTNSRSVLTIALIIGVLYFVTK